jgi:hypothetical protein
MYFSRNLVRDFEERTLKRSNKPALGDASERSKQACLPISEAPSAAGMKQRGLDGRSAPV